jgi:hypothetical protein
MCFILPQLEYPPTFENPNKNFLIQNQKLQINNKKYCNKKIAKINKGNQEHQHFLHCN